MRGEYFVLGLFAVLGMMVLVSAGSFLTLYLGLELLSLSLYAMVALDRESRLGCEAAMKYFVLGALASGMLLYGISMIYGSTGSVDLATIGESIGAPGEIRLTMVLGLVFVVVGVAFKLRGGALPHVGSRCLRGRTDAGHAVHRHRTQDSRVRHAHARPRRRSRGPRDRLVADAGGARGAVDGHR